MRRQASLQLRLLALVLGTVLAVWGAALALSVSDARHEMDELLDSHLAQTAAVLLTQSPAGAGDTHADAPLLHRYAPRTAFQLFRDGQLVLHSANAPATAFGVDAGQSGRFATVGHAGQRWRVFSASTGALRVIVAEQEASRRDILGAVVEGMLWPFALALPLLATAIWWSVRRGAAPLRALGGTLAGRAPDRLEPLPLEGVPAEIVPLVASLNGLLERIGGLLEAERRFTADAAHELRTPLAAIRMQAQVALNEPDPQRRAHALAATLQGCDRAARLIGQLLTLARLERTSVAALAPVDLSAIARSVIADLAPAALAKAQQLELEAAEPCPFPGDEALLAVLVRNLVDNAIRYAPRGAHVRVRVHPGPRLAVDDSGAGMEPQHLARLGERFFRVTGSGEAGSGLGWSIVHRIAQVHGLRVSAQRSAELGGLSVRITPAGGAQD